MQAAIERVQLAFALKVIVDVQVASNQLYIAAGTSNLLKIDLDNPSELSETKVPSGTLNKLWTSVDGQHLIAQTKEGTAFYLYNLQHLRQLKLPGKFSSLVFNELAAYFAVGHNVFQLELAPLKIDRKREQFKKVYTHKEPIDQLAIVGSEFVILAGTQLSRGSWESLEASSVPKSSTLVNSLKDFVLKTPQGILNQSHLIESKAEFVVLSKFHILAVGSEILEVYNIVSNKLVLSVAAPDVVGISSDERMSTFWIFSSSQLFEIKLEGETLGMWQTYVDKKQFDAALSIASAADKPLILQEYGDHEFGEKNYTRAAELYGRSNCHIEGIALKLLKLDPKLVVALFESRLAHTKNKVQVVVLSTWIVELLLQLHLDTELQAFVSKNISKLDHAAVLRLLKAHAQDDQILWFASLVKDHKFIIDFTVQRSLWDKALECVRDFEDEDAIYKHSNVLLAQRPKQVVELWMRIPKLDPLRLLPALLNYSAKYTGDYKDHQAIRYLRHTIANGNSAPALYNALVLVYAQAKDEPDLLHFLQEKTPHLPNYFFGLRVCLENQKHRCALYLYTQMKLWEEAIGLALSQGLVAEAIEVVDKVENDQQRKTLWLEIARHVVATDGTAIALKFVDHLNVEDLLELFPDFETLDYMAPEVVKALEVSNSKLQSVHNEMEASKKAGQDLQQKIQTFNKRYAIIEPGEWCQHCQYPLATRRFYMFPCQHGFHLDCIVGVLEQGPKATLIEAIKLSHPHSWEALDPVVSTECLVCSESKIDEIDEEVWAEW